MKLLEKVLSFETKGELRNWFNQGSASSPRIEITSTDPIIQDGKEVWQTRVCLTGNDPMTLQSRIGQAFLHVRKEFPNHTIGLTDRAYNKIKFYDPGYRETHPKKRPEKAHTAHQTAIADALAMAQERKKSKEVYRKTRNYQLGYSDRRTNKAPKQPDNPEYMKGYDARGYREEGLLPARTGRRKGLRKNSMTWILVEYLKSQKREVTRQELIEKFGEINGAIINRMLKSGVQSAGVGRYIHKDNIKASTAKPADPPPSLPQVMPGPYEANKEEAVLLRQRIAELEAENSRLKKALLALTA